MDRQVPLSLKDDVSHSVQKLLRILQESRAISFSLDENNLGFTIPSTGLLDQITALSAALDAHGHSREGEALNEARSHCLTPTDFGGVGLVIDQDLADAEEAEILFLISAYLEALNSSDRHGLPIQPLESRPASRRGMTLSEKIFAAHDTARNGEVKPGDVIRVHVDWVIASELSWSGMEKAYKELGKPGIFRNDRIWLAGDHLVDPRINNHPKIKPLIEASERARQVFKMTEYQGMNYTIMHTEFCRERAQPGMLIVGSDSHTCSAGSVSSLAVGLGVADVTIPLITGETWFKVPETVEIRFINQPKPGLSGKDVILYVLKELRRNTVAADRVVEYTGPGLKYLSCDARFAISNMTTEFGGITGIFTPDEITYYFVNKRKSPKYKKLSTYYKADPDAKYAETHIIDLAEVESFVARYPSPDDVVPVREVSGTSLDGCFIGACTTAREDLILAALVLQAGLKKGMKPVNKGMRKVVPGSRPILHDLRMRGLAAVYEEAGFEVGVPGCSYCVGMSADKAGKGEVWLSSQNRNFENRMGPGAIGSISSAVTVAASSFAMTITDPKPLLDEIDLKQLEELLGHISGTAANVHYVEPGSKASPDAPSVDPSPGILTPPSETIGKHAPEEDALLTIPSSNQAMIGKVQTLGDFIDTDALAPAEVLVNNLSLEEVGKYCLCHTHPDFRRRVKEEGLNVVVAGKAFGVGSSRENAVTALQGAGVQCVIARSFAFIYGRNQANLGLLGFVIDDDEFYKAATDGAEIRINVERRIVEVGGGEKFAFQLSEIERQLMQYGGISPAFKRWGKSLLEVMCSQKPTGKVKDGLMTEDTEQKSLSW